MKDDPQLDELAAQALDDVDATTLAAVRALYDATDPVPDRPGRAGELLARARRDVRGGRPDDPGPARHPLGPRRPVHGHPHRDADVLRGPAHRDGDGQPAGSRTAPPRRLARTAGAVRVRLRIQGRARATRSPTSRAGSASTACDEGFGQLSFHPVDDDAVENAVVTPAVPVVDSVGGHDPRSGRGAQTGRRGPATRSTRASRTAPPSATRSLRKRLATGYRDQPQLGFDYARVLLGLAAAEFELSGELDGSMALLDEAERVAGPRRGHRPGGLDPWPARAAAAARRTDPPGPLGARRRRRPDGRRPPRTTR